MTTPNEITNASPQMKKQLLYGGGGVAAIIAIIIFAFSSSGESVEQYKKKATSEINAALQDKTHAIRKRIEQAHMTVTVKTARVTGFDVTTLDGSDKAGKNGSNIKTTTIEITAYWDGLIHKDGFTEFVIEYDVQYDKVVSAKIGRTNALFNAEEVNWYEVGTVIGTLLVL